MDARKIEAAMVVKKELENLTASRPPGEPPTNDAEWRRLRKDYERDMQEMKERFSFKTRAARSAYLQNLNALQNALAQQPGAESDLANLRNEKLFLAIEERLDQNGAETTVNAPPTLVIQPHGGLLVGFKVGLGGYAGHTIVRGLQPMFLTGSGTTPGQRYGQVNPTQDVIAPPGYAVGGIEIKEGDRLDGFRLKFMRILPDTLALDIRDTQMSDWIGGGGGSTPQEIEGNGKMIIGIAIKSGADVDRLSLVQLK
jgi:hypothetical protein